METRMIIFWIVHLIILGVWALLMLYFLSIWLRSRVPGVSARSPRWRKLLATLIYILRIVFSHRLWPLVKAFILDGLLQRRVFEKSKLRWATHIGVFGSFLVLGVLSTITGVVVEGLPLFGMKPDRVAAIPFLGQFFHADVGWLALINELLGLAMLAGMLLVLYRRFVKRDPQLRTGPVDNFIVFLLTSIAISGILVEAFRYLADYTQPLTGVFAPAPDMVSLEKLPKALYGVWGPQLGFVGYGVAYLLGLLKVGREIWDVVYQVFFWLHFVIVTALLYYLPFSRFAHAIAGPVVVAYNTMLEQEKAQHSRGHGLPQPVA